MQQEENRNAGTVLVPAAYRSLEVATARARARSGPRPPSALGRTHELPEWKLPVPPFQYCGLYSTGCGRKGRSFITWFPFPGKAGAWRWRVTGSENPLTGLVIRLSKKVSKPAPQMAGRLRRLDRSS